MEIKTQIEKLFLLKNYHDLYVPKENFYFYHILTSHVDEVLEMMRCNEILILALKASSQKNTSKGLGVDIFSSESGTLQMKYRGMWYQEIISLNQRKEINPWGILILGGSNLSGGNLPSSASVKLNMTRSRRFSVSGRKHHEHVVTQVRIGQPVALTSTPSLTNTYHLFTILTFIAQEQLDLNLVMTNLYMSSLTVTQINPEVMLFD